MSRRCEASVVIPVLDDRDRLAACLDSLGPQAVECDAEIIVVDNGSRDDPGEVVAGHSAARLVHEPARGSYTARNTGLAVASGQVVAFTDADCIPADDWLPRGIAAVGSGVDRVAGRIELMLHRPGRPTGLEQWELLNSFRQDRYVAESGWAATANLFVRRDVLDAVGPFEARLRSGGDKEWGQRASAAGFTLTYDEDLVVQHPTRRTLAELRRKYQRIAEGDIERRALGLSSRPALYLRRLVPPLLMIRQGWAEAEITSLAGRTRYAGAVVAMRYVRAYDHARLERRRRGAGDRVVAEAAGPVVSPLTGSRS